MARIIERGVALPDDAVRHRCPRCRCLFEFSRDEARLEPDVMDGDALVIACPGCGAETWLAVAKAPPHRDVA